MDSELAEALHTYVKSLRRYAMAMTRDSSEADDLVQECLKRALIYIHNGREIQNLRAYLFTILNNVYADELSRKRRTGTVVSIDSETIRLAAPPCQNARMECRDLSWALNQLPAEQKEVVLLIGLEGLSYQTAAEVLGIPIGTVMSRLSRGRNALRRLLEGRTPADTVRPRDDNLVELRGDGRRASVA
jgi:RNA polymerase sigma-70 factor (ECF subfamily)